MHRKQRNWKFSLKCKSSPADSQASYSSTFSASSAAIFLSQERKDFKQAPYDGENKGAEK